MGNSRLKISREDFDSELLGREVGKGIVDGGLADANSIDQTVEGRFSAVILFVTHTRENIHALFKGGFKYITSKVRYNKKIEPGNSFEAKEIPGIEFVDYDESFSEDLIRLAYIVAEKSRYFLDPSFVDAWQSVYKKWALNAVNGYVDKIILAIDVEAGKALGFIFIKKDNGGKVASINLIGVDTDHQGKGIGSKLLELAEKWALEQGVTVLEVTTESENVPAQKLYQKQGYTIAVHSLVYSKQYEGK